MWANVEIKVLKYQTTTTTTTINYYDLFDIPISLFLQKKKSVSCLMRIFAHIIINIIILCLFCLETAQIIQSNAKFWTFDQKLTVQSYVYSDKKCCYCCYSCDIYHMTYISITHTHKGICWGIQNLPYGSIRGQRSNSKHGKN